MLAFFKKYSPIVAWLALILPWVPSLINHYLLKGKVIINEAGPIQIVYFPTGPSIYLRGTLVAEGKDQFITKMDIIVTKAKDNSTHKFEWYSSVDIKEEMVDAINISNKLRPPSGMQSINYNQPYPFMITTKQPFNYYILFCDISVFSDINNNLIKIKNEWRKTSGEKEESDIFGFQSSGVLMRRYMVNSDKEINKEINKLKDAFDKFSKSKIYLDIEKILDRNCYWEPGKYELKMRIYASDNQIFTKKWNFILSDYDSEIIRHNVSIILKNCCMTQSTQFNSVSLSYNSIE